MRYLPHTNEEIGEMLAAVGSRDVDDLFSTLPADCRRTRPLKLPEALTEWELNRHMDTLAGRQATAPRYKVFMGAGSYDHYILASVSYLLGRSEFSTAYTPYQPEISQGTLQAIYEYQTLVTRENTVQLTFKDVTAKTGRGEEVFIERQVVSEIQGIPDLM